MTNQPSEGGALYPVSVSVSILVAVEAASPAELAAAGQEAVNKLLSEALKPVDGTDSPTAQSMLSYTLIAPGIEAGKRPGDQFRPVPASTERSLYSDFVARGEAEASLLRELAKESVEADIAVLLAMDDSHNKHFVAVEMGHKAADQLGYDEALNDANPTVAQIVAQALQEDGRRQLAKEYRKEAEHSNAPGFGG